MKSQNIIRIEFLFVLSFFLCIGDSLVAQPQLVVLPKEIHFKSQFSKYTRITFLNTGNQNLSIDSIRYGYDRYFFRFDKGSGYTPQIAPHDSLFMDCYLLSSAMISLKDINDSMMIYTSPPFKVYKVKIHVDFFENEYNMGTIQGYVNQGISPGGMRASVYFFFNGKYLIDSVRTDPSGFFSRELPRGDYIVGAMSDSSYLTFSPSTTNILKSPIARVRRDSTTSLNIKLVKFFNSGLSFGGSVTDSVSNLPVKKGVVIVKSGTHTPGVSSKISIADTLDALTFFISPRGDYLANRLPSQSYYYAQALSDYFLPSYYSAKNTPVLFWQKADSVQVTATHSNINISMVRDSSYGAGIMSGTITANKSTAANVPGAIVYAKSKANGHIYLAGNSSSSGEFNLYEIPFGSYTLIVQRFGYPDMESSSFTIDSLNPKREHISIFNATDIEVTKVEKSYLLLQNYPNPFNPATMVAWSIPYASDVEVTVYSSLGQKVADLYRGYQSAGSYQMQFNVRNTASGVYFIKLTTNREQKIIKALALK